MTSMSKNKYKIAIITNVIPNYREDFYKKIIENRKYMFDVYCQRCIPGMKLKTVHNNFVENVKLIKFCSAQKERVCWQFLPLLKLYSKYDAIVFYGNPRVVSNVFYSILLKLLRKRIIIWGQVHTAGANPIMEKIRLSWWYLFKYLFVYTESDIVILRKRGFVRHHIVGMNNGLNQEAIEKEKSKWSRECLEKWKNAKQLQGKILLLSCARLESKNEFELMIPVLKDLIGTHPNILWCVIGDGSQRDMLYNLAENSGINRHIVWVGEIYEEDEIAPWFLSSTALVHPGAIGLSLLHAFGYGLPVITHDDTYNQMPEFSALKDEINGLLFKKSDYVSLANTIKKLIESSFLSARLGKYALNVARHEFNSNVMSQRFFYLLSIALSNKR